MPSILAVARRFPPGAQISRQELVQEGVAGLLLAARRYDPSLGTPFWAYASFWVRKAMQELVAELTRPVSLSDRAARELAALRRPSREYLQAVGAEPTAAQLARASGFDRQGRKAAGGGATAPRDRGAGPRPTRSASTVGETIRDPPPRTPTTRSSTDRVRRVGGADHLEGASGRDPSPLRAR